jgi:predicted acetyltransferase
MSKVTAVKALYSESTPLAAPLQRVPPFEDQGLRFRVSHILESNRGVPGYRFEVSDERGVVIGDACMMIAADLDAVARTGHLGGEVLPEFRGRGYTLRMAQALVPLARAHGVSEILFTCAEGHESLKQTFRELGAVELDELEPEMPEQPRLSRFLLADT